jgi:hypothetical protein
MSAVRALLPSTTASVHNNSPIYASLRSLRFAMLSLEKSKLPCNGTPCTYRPASPGLGIFLGPARLSAAHPSNRSATARCLAAAAAAPHHHERPCPSEEKRTGDEGALQHTHSATANTWQVAVQSCPRTPRGGHRSHTHRAVLPASPKPLALAPPVRLHTRFDGLPYNYRAVPEALSEPSCSEVCGVRGGRMCVQATGWLQLPYGSRTQPSPLISSRLVNHPARGPAARAVEPTNLTQRVLCIRNKTARPCLARAQSSPVGSGGAPLHPSPPKPVI